MSPVNSCTISSLRSYCESGPGHQYAREQLQDAPRCGQIFRYAIATGRATRDITSDLRGAVAPVVVENRAAITEPAKMGSFVYPPLGSRPIAEIAAPEVLAMLRPMEDRG